jgi:uncharacterized membrane protein HdeD (DUF308 family)
MAEVVAERQEEEILFLPWWLVLIEGLATVAIGLLVLIYPIQTVSVLVIFLGAYWFVTGLFSIFGAVVHKYHRVLNTFMCLIGIAAGLTIIINPVMGTVVVPGLIVIILGVEGVLMGAAAVIQAVQGAGPGRFIFGLGSLVIGLILIFNQPFAIGLTALPFAMGVFAVFIGIAELFASCRIRKKRKS